MFASLASNPDIPAVSVNLSLKVDPTLHWPLSCHGVRVELDQCSALSAAPHSAESASALLSILHTITQCEICAGNAQEFQGPHRGTFKSRDGILHQQNHCLHRQPIHSPHNSPHRLRTTPSHSHKAMQEMHQFSNKSACAEE